MSFTFDEIYAECWGGGGGGGKPPAFFVDLRDWGEHGRIFNLPGSGVYTCADVGSSRTYSEFSE